MLDSDSPFIEDAVHISCICKKCHEYRGAYISDTQRPRIHFDASASFSTNLSNTTCMNADIVGSGAACAMASTGNMHS